MKNSVMQCSAVYCGKYVRTVRTNDPSFKDQTDTNPPRDPVAIKSPNPIKEVRSNHISDHLC